jgi:hypothetical protein
MLQSWQAQRAVLESLHRTAHTAAYDAARKAVDAVLLCERRVWRGITERWRALKPSCDRLPRHGRATCAPSPRHVSSVTKTSTRGRRTVPASHFVSDGSRRRTASASFMIAKAWRGSSRTMT